MKKLVINFCKDADELNFKNINDDIIDISEISPIKNIDYDFNIDFSLNFFFCIIDQIYEDEFIKNLKIGDYPAYHLTAISQKHSEIHWLNDFCHFLTLIKLNARSFQKYDYLDIHLPFLLKENETFIRNFIANNKLNAKLNFIYHGKNFNIYSIIKACINILIKYLRFSFFFKKKNENKNADSIFITSSSTKTSIYLALKNIYTTKKEKISLINLNFWTDRSSWEQVDRNLIRSKPNLFLIFNLFYDVLKIIRLSNKNTYGSIDICGLKLNKTFLSIEIIKIIADQFCLQSVINYNWLKMFLSMDNHPKKIFYEDEFYNFGKCISVAKNNSINAKKIDTFGIQHGHINIYQTLYSLSDQEAISNFPAPDYFIVWSKYYQNILNKNNISKVTKILPLGSLVHFDKFKEPSKNLINFDNIKILWCLTDQYSFMTELNILKNSNLWKNADIKIRQHPNSKFLEDTSFEKHGIFNDMILDSGAHLFDHIKESDVIITTWYSTIIIDALINEKSVIALSNDSFKNSLEGTNINVCSSSSELDNLFKNKIKNKKQISEEQILSKLIILDSSIFINYFFNSKKI